MDIESYKLKIVLIVTVGFALASLLGYLSHRIKLSPILGYLMAGYFIGPYSPGFVADVELSEQLAEIGVILMMFGVGMHFKWEDLNNVKNIAIPGAVGQILVACLMSTLLIYQYGWSLETGIVIGLAIGVASTVVLVRILTDYNVLNTIQGHIAVGWLIVEDIFTIIALILLPTLASFQTENFSIVQLGKVGSLVLGKFFLMTLLMFTVGRMVVKYSLVAIARVRSNELFTVTVLALTFVIATGSSVVFGTSIALGAFIAGMVIGQTDVKHQASANSLPLKDAFVVIFFLSVGMLFNPPEIFNNPALFFIILFVILIVKPLAAFLIVIGLKYPLRTALTVSIALAQIGEFSFILAEEAMKLNLLPDEGYDIIVACALVSIAINPLFFKCVDLLSNYIKKKESENASQNGRQKENVRKGIIVGFGPIGRKVAQVLENEGIIPIIIDTNVDTITTLTEQNKHAVYGDATVSKILEIAEANTADFLIITVPEIESVEVIAQMAREINEKIVILARAEFLSDKPLLENIGIPHICCEEEGIKAFQEKTLSMCKKAKVMRFSN